jgi:RNA-binding protein 25
MIKYLGELDDDDMVMFVVEHLKDHKPPSKIVEGLEPVSTEEPTSTDSVSQVISKVLLEEAAEFTISLWRQVVFESIAYSEGFETDDMMVD